MGSRGIKNAAGERERRRFPRRRGATVRSCVHGRVSARYRGGGSVEPLGERRSLGAARVGGGGTRRRHLRRGVGCGVPVRLPVLPYSTRSSTNRRFVPRDLRGEIRREPTSPP